jgi:hypothetical protein
MVEVFASRKSLVSVSLNARLMIGVKVVFVNPAIVINPTTAPTTGAEGAVMHPEMLSISNTSSRWLPMNGQSLAHANSD